MPQLKWIAALTGWLFALNSQASSEAAWQILDKAAVQACVSQSSMKQIKVVGKRVDFADSTGYSALILSGQYNVKSGKAVAGKELCLYHRRTKIATLAEM